MFKKSIIAFRTAEKNKWSEWFEKDLITVATLCYPSLFSKPHVDLVSRLSTAHRIHFLEHVLPQISLPLGRPGPRPDLMLFLAPLRARNSTSISIGSAAFAGLTVVSNRQTDRPHYIDNNRSHLMLCIVMRPNNTIQRPSVYKACQ